MASWNGNSDSSGEQNDNFMLRSVSQTQLVPHPPEEICPDSDENVREQTEDLFRNFVYQRYRNDNIQQSYDNDPVDPEIVNFPRIPDSPAAEVGRQLARIGDDIDKKYKNQFDEMIRSLNIGPDIDSAYEAFSGIARKILADGINWGRILTLLCFGYHFVVKAVHDRVGNFLQRTAQMLLRFLITDRISEWIANNGGWRAALTFIPTADNCTFAAIVVLACVSVVAVIAWNRCRSL